MKASATYLLILLITLSINGFGQYATPQLMAIDSLLSIYEYEEARRLLEELPESNELESLVLWADYHLSVWNNAEAAKYYRQLTASKYRNDSTHHLMIAKGLNDLGIAYYRMGEMDSAVQAHHRSLEWYRPYRGHKGFQYNYNNLAIIAKEQKQYEQALDYYGKSLQAALSAHDTVGVAYNHLNRAMLLADNVSYLESLDYFYRALELFGAAGESYLQAVTNIRLSAIYVKLNSADSAFSKLIKAKKIFLQNNKEKSMVPVYFRLAQVHYDYKHYDSVAYYLDHAEQLSNDTQSPIYMADIHMMKGDLHLLDSERSEARLDYEKAVEYSQGKYLQDAFRAQIKLAELDIGERRFAKAIDRLTAGFNKIQTMPAELESQVYRLLYEAHKGLNQIAMALSYLEKHTEIQPRLMNSEKALEVARIEYRDYLEFKQKEERLMRERMRDEYQTDIDRQQLITYSTIGIGILLLTLAIIVYNLYHHKKTANRLLTYKNQTIESKNEELKAKNEELSALREKDYENQQREKQLLQETIHLKERELAGIAMVNHEKNSVLSAIDDRLNQLSQHADEGTKTKLKELKKTVSLSIDTQASWDSFIHQFDRVHPDFFQKLKTQYPSLSVNDLKISAYIKVGMDNKEIAQASNIALSTVKKNINRLKKKLELGAEESIRDFLLQVN